MFRMDPTTLRTTFEDLEKATRDQADWHAQAMRTIVCRVPCNSDDLAEDAHRRCRFGQWYYGTMSDALRSQPDFVSLEAEHRRVHGLAARLLRQATDAAAIDLADYDAFVASSAKVRRQLASLRHEIQGVLRSSDVLTGAYGRAEVLPELRDWRALARRGVAQCCIAFMDVDDLKGINDTHGHTVGDHVLAGVVHYLTSNLRPHDKVFRYGGDEFVILLPVFRARHPARTVELEMDDLPLVSIDPVLIRRVVENLLDNASKYSDLATSIEVSAVSSSGGVSIRVADKGIGIDGSDLQRVFTPFFRTDRSRSRTTGGFGLGLAFARRVVEAHGGTIQVVSNPDEGTAVSFLVPVDPSTATPEVPTAKARRAS